MSPREVAKRLRKLLGTTQGELAAALGISLKAVQSYEQGWRNIPPRVIKQLLTLVVMHRADKMRGEPCWSIRGCDPLLSANCPARKLTQGYYCWTVSSKACADVRGDDDPTVLGCLDCPVVQQFIAD